MCVLVLSATFFCVCCALNVSCNRCVQSMYFFFYPVRIKCCIHHISLIYSHSESLLYTYMMVTSNFWSTALVHTEILVGQYNGLLWNSSNNTLPTYLPTLPLSHMKYKEASNRWSALILASWSQSGITWRDRGDQDGLNPNRKSSKFFSAGL